ncbi:MAG: hypothetical protein M1830_004071, partial [Pleopsidium flavum]
MLPQITHGVNELPDELQEVVEIIAAQLNTRLSLEERGLLDDDLEYFLNHISPIGKALSTQLSGNALQLAKIAYPQESNPTILRTKAPSLPETLTTRRTALLQT